MARSQWLGQSDSELLADCSVDTYRASGPGGQKRNKTSSAVRIRHHPSELLVIAEESRSQHENKAKALQRLRRTIAIEIREPVDLTRHELTSSQDENGRFTFVTIKDERFWPCAGAVLDVIISTEGQISTAAELLKTTTGNLISFLEMEVHVWQFANQIRQRFGLKTLKQ